MAVRSKREGDKLILDVDNGDFSKLEDVMQKWGFRDYQSFFRFVISTLVLAEEKVISIKLEGYTQEIVPAAHLLKSDAPSCFSEAIDKQSIIDKKEEQK